MELSVGYKKVKISVIQNDITEEKVDAIVNAANKFLSHGGGVAGAISYKGGRSIQLESDEYIERNGYLETGQVMTTAPGRLPCKHIIHAVGPIYRDGLHSEVNLLQTTVNNSLIKAQELRCKSISIPAISSGIFGFPKPLCAVVVIKAVYKFIDANPSTCIEEIRLTNFDKETVMIFRGELMRMDRRLGSGEDLSSDEGEDSEGEVRKKPKLNDYEEENSSKSLGQKKISDYFAKGPKHSMMKTSVEIVGLSQSISQPSLKGSGYASTEPLEYILCESSSDTEEIV